MRNNKIQKTFGRIGFFGLAGIFLFAIVSCVSVYKDKTLSGQKYGTVYISNTGSATVSVIDLNTQQIIKTVDLTGAVAGDPAQSHFISVTPDGKYLWVGERHGSADGKVLVVNTKNGQVEKNFNVGAAIGQHLSKDGKWLF